jgi:hypothetical protein
MGLLQKARLFGRSCTLVIGSEQDPTFAVKAAFNQSDTSGVDVSGLAIEFIIEKSLKSTEPNTCQIKVANMAPWVRMKLSGQKALNVKLEAGYEGATSQLYFAQARSAWTTRDGNDYVTHIESTDTIARPAGVKKTKKIQPGSETGSLYRTMGAKVPLATALMTLTQALGIGQGNLQQALAYGGVSLTSINSSALIGNGAQRMTDICRSAGLEWSIQDGNLQLLNVGQILSTEKAIFLSDDTGLIGSPSVDSQGALSLQTLLIPGLVPGVLIQMNSDFVQGGYRIEKIRYTGDTYGNDWYAHIEAIRY